MTKQAPSEDCSEGCSEILKFSQTCQKIIFNATDDQNDVKPSNELASIQRLGLNKIVAVVKSNRVICST